MEKGDYLSAILRSNQTVFSLKDIVLLWRESGDRAKERVSYYVKKGDLHRIRRGFYAKDKSYNKFEFATKVYTPAYVGLETVLGRSGVIFQYYSQIFVVSYLTREIEADGQKYSFKKIKDPILTNSTGLKKENNYFVATKERAFLDILYLNKDYYFDNIDALDWEKVFNILPIYGNKRMCKKVEKLYHAR